MADRLVAPPNMEKDEEFLTDVDESPPMLREDDDTPTQDSGRVTRPKERRRRCEEKTDVCFY
jgi:hypothetical protein